MKVPRIDERNKEEIINYIKSIAPYYAPEWRVNLEDMDMGTVLALIFSEMFSGTIERLNKVPYKNFITFLNSINARLYPSVPAKGYITLNLVDGIDEGVMVKKGEKLSAQGESSERIIFEILNNIYVTPSKIKAIYCSSFRHDVITKLYDEEVTGEGDKISLFNKNGKNIQKHEFYINHHIIFNMVEKAKVRLYFNFNNDENALETLNLLCDSNAASWSYLINEKYEPLNHVEKKDDYIEIYKDFKNEESNQEEDFGIIKCEIKDIEKFQDMDIRKILLESSSEDIVPDRVFSNDIEQDQRRFFPFNERFSMYNDLYISCNEVFSKEESDIELKFELEFEKVPIENIYEDAEIDWKLIMKKAAFKEAKEYEISIGEVMWEYWNGAGWARLYMDEDYSKLFNTPSELQKKKIKIKFKCPEDMDKTVINSYDGYFLRVRVLKVYNAYMTRGVYISPIISNISMDYRYNKKFLPDEVKSLNNMVEKIYKKQDVNNEKEEIVLIEKIHEKNNITYFFFDKKPEGSPIKVLFSLDGILPKERPVIVWEYYSSTGWKPLSLVDETDNMRKSGMVSFLGQEDFEENLLFDQKGYWIRIYNPSKYYEEDDCIRPKVNGVYINTTSIIQNDTKEEEFFYIDNYEKNKVCKLVNDNINNIDVWVDEYGKLSKEEEDSISEKDIHIVRNLSGEVKEIWVRWTEANDFITSNKDSRDYVVDRNTGEVYFGDGINGKIPVSQNSESIKICYSIGGGEEGNIEKRKIDTLSRSLGYINRVFNPIETSGGCDRETIDSAIERSPNVLINRGRAVTLSDYENLCIEASRDIKKARCFSGLNSLGEKEPGTITLVVLQNGDFGNDVYFNGLREKIYDYLVERNMNMLNKRRKFNIISPCFIEMTVKVEAEVSDLDSVFSVKHEIEETINRFIDPIRGKFDGKGWEIGELPVRTQILNSLKNIKNIKKITNIILSASINNKGNREDIDLETFSRKIYAMPLNGKHIVNVVVKQ
ncbi:baseplate J/gp47 family protein [uncultured Clostridium sp.]|uniref:baseplate J/gp47 family protein n=1 Tax=uncultured Clostridium sp. TaxID=59620 RepID=UPI0025EBB3BD|nr:hypothetical protein [uncultured Clostridium sp.]